MTREQMFKFAVTSKITLFPDYCLLQSRPSYKHKSEYYIRSVEVSCFSSELGLWLGVGHAPLFHFWKSALILKKKLTCKPKSVCGFFLTQVSCCVNNCFGISMHTFVFHIGYSICGLSETTEYVKKLCGHETNIGGRPI